MNRIEEERGEEKDDGEADVGGYGRLDCQRLMDGIVRTQIRKSDATYSDMPN